MKVTEIKFSATEIGQLILGPTPPGVDPYTVYRSPGLHLSQIYRDLEETVAPKNNNFDERELETFRAMGFIWEWMLSDALNRSRNPADCVRPGEFVIDGIIGSPDLIQSAEWCVIDSKATWRSSNKLNSLEKYFWTWLVQLKGYCYMVKAEKARLLVFCVNGTYAPPTPCIRQFDLDFTAGELQENWEMLVRHARKRGWLK